MRACLCAFLLALLISCSVSAQSNQDGNASIADHQIHAIVLLPCKSDMIDVDSQDGLWGLRTRGLSVPGGEARLHAQLIPIYMNEKLDQKLISEIKSAIYSYYERNGLPFIVVSVPSQNLTKGVLQIVIQESKVGKIEVVGNKWAPKKTVQNYIQMKKGDCLSQKRLLKDLDFMNRNPFRRVSLIYSAGEEKNTTDLTFDIEARKPYRFYAGIDDTGIPTIGRQRVFAGFSWDQMFQLDQILFFQYTTNYSPSKFHAYTIQYTAYLPWEAVLNLYGGYSSVHANVGFPNRTNHGQSGQASLRVNIPFAPSRSFVHEFIFGADWKITNNTVEYIDTAFPRFAQGVNISQGVLGYVCKYQKENTTAESGIEMFFSPAEILPGQSNADFASLRPGAKNTWVYFNGYLTYEKQFEKMAYHLYFRGQASSQVLLPNEQLGIGGYATVRGYDQRQLSVDSGMYLNNELRFPACSIIRSKQPHADRFQFLLFFDVGGGTDYKKIFTIKPRNFLMGAGPGARYQFGNYLTARLDWGIKLHHQDDFTGGQSMLHFSVIGSY